MSVAIAEYSQACGPGAYAALAGITRDQAAGALCRWSQRAGHSPSISTSRVVLAAALISRGFRLERWAITPGGWRTRTADEFARGIWRTFREDAAWIETLAERVADYHAHLRSAPAWMREGLERDRAIRRERSDRVWISPLTVGEWLRRFPIGTWLLHVSRHVIVARAGHIVAGDDMRTPRYLDCDLEDVLRVRYPA